MPKIFVISDTWFNRVLNDGPDVDTVDSNESIIFNWNTIVTPDDTVYVLGGFGILDLYNIVIQLKGNIHFLNNVFNPDEEMYIENVKESIEWVKRFFDVEPEVFDYTKTQDIHKGSWLEDHYKPKY